MTPETQKAIELLEQFTAERSESVGGGWAPVGENDIIELHRLVRVILEAKYQQDADGSRPVDVLLVDRTKFEPLHYRTIPYEHKCDTKEGREWRFHILLTNLSIASRDMGDELRLRRLDRDAQEAKDNP